MSQYATVPARCTGYHPDGTLDTEAREPGAFWFYRLNGEPEDVVPAGLLFVCPCGCEKIGTVQFRHRDDATGGVWTWDGNREQPTVTPSVFFSRGEAGEWHGFLTAGVWVGC